MAGIQNFELTYAGRNHLLTVADEGLSRRYVWAVEGTEVLSHKSIDDRLTLKPEGSADAPGTEPVGEIHVRAGLTGVKRATLAIDGEEIDLVPEAGSAAARREARIRTHPQRHLVLHTTAAIAKVLIPVLGIGLVLSWLPDWDLPSIPFPDIDLPSIPWPSIDLPSIPWPDWELPSWVRSILDKAKYVWPVLLAFGIAQHEVKRRREQDQRRTELGTRPDKNSDKNSDVDASTDTSTDGDASRDDSDDSKVNDQDNDQDNDQRSGDPRR